MRARLDVIGVVAAGGVLGTLGRYGAVVLLGASPSVTLAVNVTGCLLIGVLAALTIEARAGHPLLRPFLGTGVLGGFTTFSGYAVDAQRLLADGRVAAAALYLGGTVGAALLAVQAGLVVARLAGRSGR